MAPHYNASLEPQKEVLADRFHALEDAAVDRTRDAGREAAGVRALGLDALADKHLQPARDPMEAVALGHVSRRAPTRARGRR